MVTLPGSILQGVGDDVVTALGAERAVTAGRSDDILLAVDLVAHRRRLGSGLSGFAFSAVAGAILLHMFPPMEAVPLMMACSITGQAANLFALRKSMQWKTSLVFIAGGLLGIPIAIYLLQNVDIGISRLGFGGGLVGALTAMPGTLPAIWCDTHGLPKTQQRGLVQPYIGVMQLFALALMLSHHSLSLKLLIDFGISLPALAAGTAVGIVLFGRINGWTSDRSQ